MDDKPFDQAAMFAWANLVGVLIDAIAAAGVPNISIHRLLDDLDDANRSVLRDPARNAYLQATAVLREGFASND